MESKRRKTKWDELSEAAAELAKGPVENYPALTSLLVETIAQIPVEIDRRVDAKLAVFAAQGRP